MDFQGVVRIGTNPRDKRIFMNLPRMVTRIQAGNGGRPITDADRKDIARKLGVTLEAVQRMEPRIFVTDAVINHTDAALERDRDRTVNPVVVIACEGGQGDVEASLDQRKIMSRIHSIVKSHFEARNLEIVQARLSGDMTREKFDVLVEKHGISVERIRQIQHAALLTIRKGLQREGITEHCPVPGAFPSR